MPDRKRFIALDVNPREPRSGPRSGAATEPPASGVRRASRAPAPRIARFETDDVDEARTLFGQIYAEATLEPLRGAPFGGTLEVAGHGPLRVVEVHWTGGYEAASDGCEERYVVSLALEGRGEANHRGQSLVGVPGEIGAVFSPGYPLRLRVEHGYRGVSFTIERGTLEAHLRALTGRELREPLSFDPILLLDSGATGALHAILQLFRREVRRSDSSPLWLTGLRDAVLTSLLVNTRNSASEIVHAPPPRVAPRSVWRAEEFIEAHAGEALSLGDIVAAVGVPARSLRAAFASSRGVGPMEYLRQCRLELGRRMLQGGDERTTVASVVSALGLGAAGRFSVEYRRRFGESPSETLAAGRGAGRSVPEAVAGRRPARRRLGT